MLNDDSCRTFRKERPTSDPMVVDVQGLRDTFHRRDGPEDVS